MWRCGLCGGVVMWVVIMWKCGYVEVWLCEVWLCGSVVMWVVIMWRCGYVGVSGCGYAI